jgi:hypothetical protein
MRLAVEIGQLVAAAAEHGEPQERHEQHHDPFADHDFLSPGCDLDLPGKFTLAAPPMVAVSRAACVASISFRMALALRGSSLVKTAAAVSSSMATSCAAAASGRMRA